MVWGTGEWGTSEWGTGPDEATLALVSVSPVIVEEQGGTIVTLGGSGFNKRIEVVMFSGATEYPVIITDVDFDIFPSILYFGTPALPEGVYGVRARLAGQEAELENALTVRAHAYELKVEEPRRKWAPVWNLGPRLLTRGI